MEKTKRKSSTAPTGLRKKAKLRNQRRVAIPPSKKRSNSTPPGLTGKELRKLVGILDIGGDALLDTERFSS